MANRPILQNIMNATLSGVRAMPLKESTADNSSSFAADRAQYYRSFDSNNVPSNKKWMGTRDASDVVRRRRSNGVALGSFNANGETMSFATKETLTIDRARQRVRSGGSIVPPKVSKKRGVVYTVPDAPTDLIIVSVGNEQITISFTPPVLTGNTEITGYNISTDNGSTYTFAPLSSFTLTGSTLSTTITGLTNGTTYDIKVQAVNIIGASISTSKVSGTPYTTPSAPIIRNVTTTVSTATIRIDAPTSNGGSTILSYTVTSNPGNIQTIYTVSGSTTYPLSITLSGLSTGTSYTFNVFATNAAGSGQVATSSSAIPDNVPNAPSITSFSAGNTTATLTFNAPSNNGGSAITSYTVYSTPETTRYTVNPTFSYPISVQLTGLTNGINYALSVFASNNGGSGASATSSSVTPSTVPDAPTITSATSTLTTISVYFTPGSTGGVPITNYSYSLDGTTYTARSPANTTSPIVLTGLTQSTSYTVYIKAINSNGSSNSTSTTLSTLAPSVPDAPTSLSVSTDDQTLIISFTQGSDGGSSITNYAYSTNGTTYTDFSPPDTVSPVTITGLTNGTPYTVYLKAKNAIGYSVASSSVTGTPNLIPDAIRAALTTTVSSYDAATRGTWVKITAAEYANLAATITSTTKVAATDTILNAVVSGGINNAGNVFIANHVASNQVALPANSYLYAIAVQWSSKTTTNQTLAYVNNSSTSYSGFSAIGGYLPNLVGGNPGVSATMTKNYYVLKKPPTTATSTNGGILGFFTGMNNIDSYGSGWWLGQVERTVGSTIRPGQGFHYAANTPAEPTSSTVMTGALTGLDNYAAGIQGLSTTTKQW